MAMIFKSRLDRMRKRAQAKRTARNQRYVRPMDDHELKNRLIYMMKESNPAGRLAFQKNFPKRFAQLEEIFKKPSCPT